MKDFLPSPTGPTPPKAEINVAVEIARLESMINDLRESSECGISGIYKSLESQKRSMGLSKKRSARLPRF